VEGDPLDIIGFISLPDDGDIITAIVGGDAPAVDGVVADVEFSV